MENEWPYVLANEEPNPDEVNEFYNILKSHPKFSVLPREDLLEVIQKELRSRNREVIEGQEVHKKYLNFVEYNYVSLHPELHDLANWDFDEDALEAIKHDIFQECVKVQSVY
jgi:hypothetical protein